MVAAYAGKTVSAIQKSAGAVIINIVFLRFSLITRSKICIQETNTKYNYLKM